MQLIKIMYYINIALLIIETIIIYIYNGDTQWLCVMLMAIIVELISVSAHANRKHD